MRIMVTGARGMLGRAVVEELSSDHEIKGVDLEDGDLTSPETAPRLLAEFSPEWVIHCAAWTDVDGAETSPDQALAANGEATAHLVAACDAIGCGLTYISTDYVFDGEGDDEGYIEDQARNPVNQYGASKAAGEEAMESMNATWQIVRISWLFGDGPVNFPRTIRRLLGERENLRVVDDQLGCPTYAPDLAKVLAFLVSGRYRGIFHVTNSGACTWHTFAREVALCLKTDPDRIAPCGSDEYPTVAKRPRCSVLKSQRLEAEGCPPRPSWQDALARYMALLEDGQARHG